MVLIHVTVSENGDTVDHTYNAEVIPVSMMLHIHVIHGYSSYQHI
jgi:hypothetical protein